MAPGFQRTVRLKRRLRRWHIFFIAIGGVIGIGFFQGTSKTLAVAGPGGALMATVIVGLVATAVMESICHLICIWPIPNAMVEFVGAFVDEDLGTAIGILYWYTYCVTFSVLVTAIGRLTDYWGEVYLRKTGVYIATPLVLMVVNFAPVSFFGWVELLGGIIKVALVLGIFFLMLILNLGGGSDSAIGTTFINEGVQFNTNVAATKFAAVSSCFPPAIFAYVGVELLTTTAFEARDPREMRFPARNIGWISLTLYGLTAGVFVANVSWTDQNLPQLFNQALTMATDSQFQWKELNINSDVHAAPLIVLLRLGYRFLPGFLNGCLIYSAFSCANTAFESNMLRGFLGWMGRVEHRTRAPWPAVFVSVLVFYWLPFIRRDHNYQTLEDIQDVLAAAGSVSCVLVWCSQCVAYSFFYHWRSKHWDEISQQQRYISLLDDDNTGWLYIGQPYISYLAAFAALAIGFFFNTVSLWNGDRLVVKAISAFAGPTVLLLVYLIKKFTRPRNHWKFWNDLSRWYDFEKEIQYLNDLIFPLEPDAQSDIDVNIAGKITTQEIKPVHAINTVRRSISDVSSAAGGGNGTTNRPVANDPSQAIGTLRLTPLNPDQVFPAHHQSPIDNRPVSPIRPDEHIDAASASSNRAGIAVTTTSYDENTNTNNSSPTNRFYNGRSTLSPQDVFAYQQQHQQQAPSQPQVPRTSIELMGSTTPDMRAISPPTSRDIPSPYNQTFSQISREDAGHDYSGFDYNRNQNHNQSREQNFNQKYNQDYSNSVGSTRYNAHGYDTTAPRRREDQNQCQQPDHYPDLHQNQSPNQISNFSSPSSPGSLRWAQAPARRPLPDGSSFSARSREGRGMGWGPTEQNDGLEREEPAMLEGNARHEIG